MPDISQYPATRLTYSSAHDYTETRARFEARVPLMDQAVLRELVRTGAEWSRVESTIAPLLGPDGFTILARVDSGSLFTLGGEQINTVLYLIGNPLLARNVIGAARGAALGAPFRVTVFDDGDTTKLAYDQPSTVLAPYGSPVADKIGADLDGWIQRIAEDVCAAGD
jgi:uncharacterized protein (DUF302 family)